MQRIYQSGNLIYYDVPKAASTSIKTALGIPELKVGYAYGDKPEGEVVGFKFSFVRDPADRLLSIYEMYLRYTHLAKLYRVPSNLSDFLECAIHTDDNLHWIPQYHFLPIIDNKIQLDFLGRFERLAEDWAYLQSRFDLPDLPKLNAVTRLWREIPIQYRKAITKRYAKDYELFGYDPQ